MSFKSVAEFLALEGDDAPTTAEQKLIEATQAGEACYLCDFDFPTVPTSATDKTRIRATLLHLLVTGGSPDCDLHERGVSLHGGWIEGTLDLAYCTAKGQSVLDHCHFADEPRFEQARFHLLSLQNSNLSKGISAQGVRVSGGLFLRNINANGMVEVNGAKIDGQISFIGARFDGGKDAQGARQTALNAQGVVTGENFFLSNVSTIGTVDISGARIGGQLVCRGATFDGGKDVKGEQQVALSAFGVVTQRDLFLSNVNATGTVDLTGAKIGGQLDCEGAHFDRVADATGLRRRALHAQRMQVTESFIFRKVASINGLVDLTAAQVGDLADDLASWPLGKDQLILDGFRYDRTVGPITFASRRDWLKAGSHTWGEFRPQPYTQLAKVLRQMGHAGEARLVLIEREGLLAEHRIAADHAAYRDALHGDQTQRGDAGWIWLRMTGFRLWTWLTKTIAGYGYAPQRALYCSLVVVPLYALAYALFWQMGAMVPADAIILATPEWANAVAENPSAPSHAWAGHAASHYETFYSLPYALDVFLPIVDLGQQSTWSQTTVTWWGWGARVTTWVLQSLGYIITSLGLAAATGIIQRNQPD